MRKATLIFIHFLISVFFISCKSSKPVVSNSAGRQTSVSSGARSAEDNYISLYAPVAISEMKRTGVPASITLAQGMIESDMGRSRLASSGNNHFGIKCHNGWTGQTIYHDDDRRNDCFRKYKSVAESFRDHSDFLRTGSRYSSLFKLEADNYRGWAVGLKKAGYATNPDYANMLIRKIEEFNLDVYDHGYTSGAGKVKYAETKAIDNEEFVEAKTIQTSSAGIVARPSRILENNRIRYIIVKDGETREKLEKEFQLLKWELPKYNELPADFSPVSGQILYLQPKREKAVPGKEFHTVDENDTMYLISQKYGIKLKSLYEMNRAEPGSEPAKGSKLWLRSLKPVR